MAFLLSRTTPILRRVPPPTTSRSLLARLPAVLVSAVDLLPPRLFGRPISSMPSEAWPSSPPVAAAKNHERAASAIVLSPSSNTTSRWDVLMLQRSDRGTFRRALVFPGGKVDEADLQTAKDWITTQSTAITTSREEVDPEELALRIAAVRETFEETSLLLCPCPTAQGDGQTLFRPILPSEWEYTHAQWHELVEHVHSNPSSFGPLLLRATRPPPEGTAPAHETETAATAAAQVIDDLLCALPPYTRWWAPIIPEAFGKGPFRKFDTSFFFLRLDRSIGTGLPYDPLVESTPPTDSEQAIARPDGAELTAIHLDSASALLQRGLGKVSGQKKAQLYPPQLYILSDMATSSKTNDRFPARHEVPMVPLVVASDTSETGLEMLLPFDSQYDVAAQSNSAAELARLASYWAKVRGDDGKGTHRIAVSVSPAGLAPSAVQRQGVPGVPDISVDSSKEFEEGPLDDEAEQDPATLMQDPEPKL